MKKLFIISILCLITSCETKKKRNIFKELLPKICKSIEKPIPSAYVYVNLYIKIASNKYVEISIDELKYIYDELYTNNNESFCDFTKKIIDEELTLSINLDSKKFNPLKKSVFILDKQIINCSFKTFKKLYLINKEDHLVLKNNLELTDNQFNNIGFYMFKQGYILNQNCYNGTTSFQNTTKHFIL